MITSKTKHDNYFGYLIFEILMVGLATFLGVICIAFYFIGRSDTRNHNHSLEYLFDSPFMFALIGLLPAVIAVFFLIFFRNRNYIVGYDFDDNNQKLLIMYRGLKNKTIQQVDFNYQNVIAKSFKEFKFIFNEPYSGVSLVFTDNHKSLDFIKNNFIWEKQPREKNHFIQKLIDIKALSN